PIRVLDVGWGLERVSWFTQGTPTIYEATFGPIFIWLKKDLGISVDKDLMLLYGRYVGMVKTESDEIFSSTRKALADKLGISEDEFRSIFGPLEAMYAILDHVKTVIMAIPDGGIPANIGGAANLRAILRRAISLAEKYQLEIAWDELILRSVEYFSRTFHRIKGIEKIAIKIWHLEQDRFLETIQNAIRELKNIARKTKKKIIDFPILRDLYLNYGIPPEEVEYLSNKLDLGITVKISSDFYDRLKEMYNKPDVESTDRKTIEREIVELLGKEINNLPHTRKLYYEDQFLKEFEAEIVFSKDRFLVLNMTAFYPRGGGQEGDSGIIIAGGKEYRVVNVFKVGDVIIHELNEAIHENTGKVKGIIDWNRRLQLMRHHTATHIINGAAQRVLGPHVWQMGAEKKVDKAHLDISHYENLSFEELKEIEKLANKVVLENRPVYIEFMNRTDAERKFGVKIYQGGAVPSAVLRIVNIDGWDVEACGGTHLPQTILVGPIKILGSKKIHDGIIRLEFTVGEYAIDHIISSDRHLYEACEVFKVRPEKLAETSSRFFSEWKRQKDELQKLWKYISDNIEKLVSDKVVSIDGKKFLLERIDLDLNSLFNIVNRLESKTDNILLVSTTLAENIFIAKGDEAFRNTIKEVLKQLRAEYKEAKDRIFGKLEIPSDNLLIIIRKRILEEFTRN
ncbi:MAG: alanine--tRNA ligase-related protein, partial [Crenarchaeota archaeon]|nr:alanine--tRNA ligase-related protein [Thermoproteota archaeon]